MFKTQEMGASRVAYNYYGDRIATCSNDQYVKVWDKTNKGQWTLTSSLKAHSAFIRKVTWAHPDYGQVLSTCSCDSIVTVWEEIVKDAPESGEKSTRHWVNRTNLEQSNFSVTDVKFGPKIQGLQLATCSEEGIIRIYEALDVTNLSHWTLQHEIQCTLSLSCLDWNPSLSQLHPLMIAVGSNETDVRVGGKILVYEYSQNNGKWIELDTIKSQTEPVNDIAFAPNLENSFSVLGVATKDVRIIKLTFVEDEQSAQKVLEELDIPIQVEDKGCPTKIICWNVNSTVLAYPEDDDVSVRMFRISGSPARTELCLLPLDEDQAGRQAVYYAIRSGDIELLNTIIDQWPGKYFSAHPDKLDEILSKAYEELKLKNVPLSEQIEFFVENKLIDLRFFSNTTGHDLNVNSNFNHIKQRIDLVFHSINDLKKEYSNKKKVDDKFLFIAKFIAENIHILKWQLKSTYTRLPWEEIEFCLITFISSLTKSKEINPFCHIVLNKIKILNYLDIFAKKLEEENNIIESMNVDKLNELPNIKRQKVISEIVNSYPEFEELYNDYRQIRDIHSLEKISSYRKLALSADPKERKGQLIITRALQVTSEYLKNTLESPKLSDNTSELLLLSLPKNTREIVLDLRNSSSLSRRLEIETNADVSFFIGVQNDIKKIDNVIDVILYNNKIKIIRTLLKKIVNIEGSDGVKEVAEILSNVEVDQMAIQNFKIMDHEKLENNIKELSDNITDKTDHEKELLNKINNIINSAGTQSVSFKDYISGLTFITSVGKYLDVLKPGHYDIKGIKLGTTQILDNISLKIEPCRLRDIVELSVKVFHSVNSRKQHGNLKEINRLICKFFYILEFETDDFKYIEQLRGRLNTRGSLIPFYKPRKTHNLTTEQYNNVLTLKLSELENILSKTLDGDQLSETVSIYKNNKELQAVVEMLLLDILSILSSSNRLKDNHFIFDDYTPLLNGKCLLNYLAHDNALADILRSDHSLAVISNAKKLISEKVMENGKKIGKMVSEDSYRQKDKYDQGLVTITNQERMFAALKEGNLKDLKSYLKNGGDIRAKDINSWTSLHFAAKGPSLEVIKFILDQNLSPKVKNSNGQTPLHISAAHGKKNYVEFFIKKAGLHVDDMDNCNKTPLHMAAQNGFKDTVNVLLENKASTVTKHVTALSPLTYAIANNHIEVSKILLIKDANIGINEAIGGVTALLAAVEFGHVELVNFLLQNKANVNAKDSRDWTALHTAALYGHSEVATSLIQRGAVVTVEALDGSTPLHYAVLNGHEKVATVLLKHGANVNAADNIFNAPLHFAAKDKYEGIVKVLLKNKANPCVRTAHDITPLHFAAQSGSLDIVSALINHRVNIHAKDINNSTALHYAAEKGHKEVVELLVKSGARINCNNINNLTPLHTAALNVHGDVVDLLVQSRADFNTRDINGSTPLHAAAMNGSKHIVELLIKIKAEINAKDYCGLTPLHAAVTGGHKEVVNILIKNKALVNGIDNKDITPLQLAVEADNKKIVEILVANGANINGNSNNHPPLISAVRNNNKEIVEVLVANGADVNTKGGEPVLLAVTAGNEGILEVLLNNKASHNIKGPDNITPLHVAAKIGFKEVVITLIKYKCNVDALTINGTTPLYLAAQEGHEEVVKILIENGANVNLVNYEGSPLHIAAAHDHDDVVEVLLNNGIKANLRDNKNRTALELAVAHGHLHVVKRILQYQNVDLNEKGDDDWTILHVASQGTNQESNLEMVKYLVSEGSNIDARNASGSKPIHIAAREGYGDIVEFFLSKGLSVMDRDTASQTLLHYAAKRGHLEIIKSLINRSADVNSKDYNGSTPMHLAAESDSKNVIKFLLKNGAVYNAVDKFDRTPVKMATDKNVIKLLTSTDQLFEAVKRNGSSEVEHYIKEGAYVNAKNVDIVTPLHYAAWKGYREIVNVLLQNKANPNAVGKQGLSPLHYAAKFSHITVVYALLSNGAVFNALSDNGKTPSDLTTDKGITSLFKIIGESFRNVKNDNSQVVNVLNKIKDMDKLKAIINACDRENRTLITAAIHNSFTQIEELKQTSQGDVGDQINVALMLLTQGDYQKPLIILRNAFEKRMALLGPDNPGTLDIQAHIATVLYKQGAYHEALNLLNEILTKRTRILGLNDKDTLNTRGSIALLYYRQGKNDEAFNIYEEVYQKQKEILGPNHSDTLNSQFHMALVLDKQGKYEEALNMNREVLKKRTEVLGKNDPAIISAENNIAMVLSNQGKYEEALKLYKEVFHKKELVLGIHHSDTVRTLHNIAGVLCNQKKFDEALKAFREVFTFQKRILGDNHPETLNTHYNIASILFQQHKWIGALKVFRKCYDQWKAFYGTNNSTVLDILQKIDVINMMFRMQGIDASGALQHVQTEFNRAARNGDIETVQRLLKDGIDVNDKDNEGRTPLHYAVSNGQINVVNVLLKNGADVTHITNKGNTPLHTATSNGNKAIIEALLQHVSRDKLPNFINAKTTSSGTTSLHVAAKNGSLEIVKALLKHGATYGIKNKENKKPVDLSKNHSVTDVLKLVEELFGDVKKGNIEVINKLRALKPEVLSAVTNARNIQGNTLLQVAVANKHKNIAAELLEILKNLGL